MNELYFNADKKQGAREQKIFLAETPAGVYSDPALQAQVELWIKAHKNDPELSYGKHLTQQAILDDSGGLSFPLPRDPNSCAEKDHLALSFALIARKNLKNLLAQTLIDGVGNPEKNRKNLKNYLQTMLEDINVLQETGDYITEDTDKEFINKTLHLATTGSPDLTAHLKNSPTFERFYPAAARVDHKNLISRSRELRSAEVSSAVLTKIAQRYQAFSDRATPENSPGIISGAVDNNAYIASAYHKEKFPPAPKISRATLIGQRLFTLRARYPQEIIDWELLEQKFDAIRHIDCDDQVSYYVKNQKKIKTLDQERE